MNIKEGDLFLLGRHRLLCGNCINYEHVQKLMDGKQANILLCDPPYGIAYNPDERPLGGRQRSKNKLGGIIGDKRKNDESFNLDKFLKLLETGIIKGAVYIHASTNMYCTLWNWNLKAFKREPTIIVWIKNQFNIGRRHYHRRHEFIFYNYFKEHKFVGGRDQDEVWAVKRRDGTKYLHPTQKPLHLAKKAIRNSTIEKEIVLDLCGGSGTTLIAAEELKRTCFMMELDPHYMEIIIKRWEAHAGEQAKKA